MPSKLKHSSPSGPQLRVMDGGLGACSSTVEQALQSDGWRSVSVEELMLLPPGTTSVVKGFIIDGEMTFWTKDVSGKRPALALVPPIPPASSTP